MIKFIVDINGGVTEHDTFESAADHWDSATYAGPAVVGGIGIQESRNGVMFRDGWLVHVKEDGVVYIHPRALRLHAEGELAANDYIWIAAWGKMLSSAPHYIEREQQIAAEEGAPVTTVYRDPRLDPKQHNEWHTLESVKSGHARGYLIAYADNRNLALPDSVMEAWGLTNKSDTPEGERS